MNAQLSLHDDADSPSHTAVGCNTDEAGNMDEDGNHMHDEFDFTNSDDDKDRNIYLSDDKSVFGDDNQPADEALSENGQDVEKDWNVTSTRYQDVTPDINGLLMDMKRMLKESVDVLRSAVARKRRILHYGKAEPSIESQHFMAFADECFFCIILEIINGNESGVCFVLQSLKCSTDGYHLW